MGRITEVNRLPVVDAHIGHWQQADALPGGPIEIITGYGIAALQSQRTEYHTKGDEIQTLNNVTLPALRAERDDLFGVDAQDEGGAWFYLTQYKPMAHLRLGRGHALRTTIPNVGTVNVEDYLSIIHNFLDHWKRVNTALVAPMTLGAFAIADLQAKHDAIDAKLKETHSAKEDLNVARAEGEALFGDVKDTEQLDTAIITRLELYHVVIATKFPNQPIAQSLPPIFPDQPAALPRFDFNDRALGAGQHKTWHLDPSLPNAAVVFLKEGATELTQAYSATPGSTNAFTWTGVTVVADLDAMELRDATGRTIARGTKNAALGEPT